MKHKGLLTTTITMILILAFVMIWIGICDVKIVIDQTGNKSLKTQINAENIEEILNQKTITFVERDKETPYLIGELGIIAALDDASKEYLLANIIIDESKLTTIYDTEYLKYHLDEFNKDRSKDVLPELVDSFGTITYTPFDPGDYLDTEKLCSDIIDSIYFEDMKFVLENYYETIDSPETREYDTALYDEYIKYMNAGVTYENGAVVSLPALDLLFDLIDVVDNKVVFKNDVYETCNESIDILLQEVLSEYEASGNGIPFVTTNLEMISVGEGSWYNIVDYESELQYVLDALNDFKSETGRRPLFIQEFGNEIPDTYVEVSIKDQHVWYYEDGKLIMDSNCVTGKKDKHDTPTGVWYVNSCIDGCYLTGPTWNVWVDKWMRFTDRGHGFHDAQWRDDSEFILETYVTNGSHGCVNLPKQFAYDLFEHVDIGTCVVIYDGTEFVIPLEMEILNED